MELRSQCEAACWSVRAAAVVVALAASGAAGFGVAAQEKVASLRVLGADSANGAASFSVVSEKAAFELVLQIESTTDVAVDDLRVAVAPFADPTGAQILAAWKVDDRDGPSAVSKVPALGAVRVQVTATLPREGVHTSAITLVYAGKRETTSLTVTRRKAATTVEVLGPSAARADGWWSADARLRFALHETGGVAVTLEPPILTVLTLGGPSDDAVQARFTDVKATPSGDVALEAGGTKEVTLDVVGVADPGLYRGTLRVAAKGGAPVDKPVTIYVKRSWPVAALLIALGVVLSFFLRRYASGIRPRLVRARRVLDLRERTASAALPVLEQDEADTWRTIREQLAALDTSKRGCAAFLLMVVDVFRQASDDADLDALDGKIEVFRAWVEARRSVAAIPAGLRPQFAQPLEGVHAVLQRPTATAEEVAAAAGTLGELDAKITESVRARLREAIEDVEGKIAALREGVMSDDLFQSLYARVEPCVREAKRGLAEDRFREAEAALDAARTLFVRALSEDLRRKLSAAAPAWFTADVWASLTRRVLGEVAAAEGIVDPNEALARYEGANALYLKGAGEELGARIADLTQRIPQTPPETKTKYEDRVRDLAKHVESAIGKAQAVDLPGATREFAAAERDYLELDAELSGPGSRMGGHPAGAPAPDEVPLGGIAPRRVGALLRRFSPPAAVSARLRWLDRWMGTLDLAFTCAILVIAVLLGLQLLWASEPTWGSANDCLIAVLWGLGLHQVSGSAFTGALGLAEQFSKP